MGILQSKEWSVLLWKGIREPLMQACTNLKRLKEICILSHSITVLYGSVSFFAILCVRCFRKCWHWFPIPPLVLYPISFRQAILHCSFFGWRCIIFTAVFKVCIVLVPNKEKQRLMPPQGFGQNPGRHYRNPRVIENMYGITRKNLESQEQGPQRICG